MSSVLKMDLQLIVQLCTFAGFRESSKNTVMAEWKREVVWCVEMCFFFCVHIICCMCIHTSAAIVRHVFVHTLCVSVCIFMDAQLPAQIWHLMVGSFEEWRNLRGCLKYCVVIGIALSSVSSINVQFSI